MAKVLEHALLVLGHAQMGPKVHFLVGSHQLTLELPNLLLHGQQLSLCFLATWILAVINEFVFILLYQEAKNSLILLLDFLLGLYFSLDNLHWLFHSLLVQTHFVGALVFISFPWRKFCDFL